jgi:hypothetical protein
MRLVAGLQAFSHEQRGRGGRQGLFDEAFVDSNKMGGDRTRSMSEYCYHQVEQRRQFLIIFNNGICIASLSVEKLY